jgi:hypothetical protein
MFTVTVLEDGDIPPRGKKRVWEDDPPRSVEGLIEQLPDIRWTAETHEAVTEAIVDWLWGIIPGEICDAVYQQLREKYQAYGGNPDGN